MTAAAAAAALELELLELLGLLGFEPLLEYNDMTLFTAAAAAAAADTRPLESGAAGDMNDGSSASMLGGGTSGSSLTPCSIGDSR